jgi:hypothetical protein
MGAFDHSDAGTALDRQQRERRHEVAHAALVAAPDRDDRPSPDWGEPMEVRVVAMLDRATGSARAIGPIDGIGREAQQRRRDIEGEGRLPDAAGSHEEDGVRDPGREHRSQGIDRGRLAAGSEAVHPGRRAGR